MDIAARYEELLRIIPANVEMRVCDSLQRTHQRSLCPSSAKLPGDHPTAQNLHREPRRLPWQEMIRLFIHIVNVTHDKNRDRREMLPEPFRS
jgi:hypothetical protein